VEEIIKAVREKSKRIKIHIDAVQAAGKMVIDAKKLGTDLISISAHKIHGPKGAGALYVKTGLDLKPGIFGGGQEMGIRSGTENLPGISGFGVAADIIGHRIDENMAAVNTIKKHFIKRLEELEKIHINSPEDEFHIGNILNVSFEGVRGEVLLHALEDYNIFVSTGSACSAKKNSKNYVLPAAGLNKCQVEGSIRFSFSHHNTIDEVDKTIAALKSILPFLRRAKR
jgi:cysteine desulfurase